MDQKILREYLIALGFKIDQTGEKRVEGLLTRMDKKASKLGASLIGVATTVVVAATAFARQMEKMFYASRFADTTVENLQALEYGTRSIGLEAGRGAGALKNMASAIRSNPGLIGLLNSLGVEVKGRDKADVLVDLVAALKKMPFYVAERYANLFGIDQETLFNLQAGLDKMKEAQAARKAMSAEMGFDADQASETAKVYMGMWREVTERAGIFGMVLGDAVLPYVQQLVAETNTLMIKWAHIVKDMKEQGSTPFWKRIREGLGMEEAGEGRVKLSKDAKERLGLPEEEQQNLDGRKGVGIPKMIQKWERWRDARSANPKLRNRVATDLAAVDATGDDSDFKGKGNNVMVADEGAGDTSPGGQDDFTPVDAPSYARKPKMRPLDPELATYFASLEKKYALPPGVLDRTYAKESSRGANLLGPVTKNGQRARGPFQFMPDTQKEYGLQDVNDTKQAADAAARKWADLMKRYKGDQKLAAAAYNWGDGNLAKVGYDLSKAPQETQDYVKDVAQGPTVTIEAKPEINIYGVSNPSEAAAKVIQQQQTVNADVVRNFKLKVR